MKVAEGIVRFSFGWLLLEVVCGVETSRKGRGPMWCGLVLRMVRLKVFWFVIGVLRGRDLSVISFESENRPLVIVF